MLDGSRPTLFTLFLERSGAKGNVKAFAINRYCLVFREICSGGNGVVLIALGSLQRTKLDPIKILLKMF
jgi:hypothetical protein